MTAGIIDYDAGNLRSVETALAYLGVSFVTSNDPEKLKNADRLIFPGVGEAASAMQNLKQNGLHQLLKEYAGAGKPILGICLGFQVLLQHSEERGTECLGLIPNKVKKFPVIKGLKVPHMGWNEAVVKRRHPIFHGIPEGASFYFVHSYYALLEESRYVITETDYGLTFTSGIAKDTIIAFQFHPEKSGKFGLKLLENFFALEDF